MRELSPSLIPSAEQGQLLQPTEESLKNAEHLLARVQWLNCVLEEVWSFYDRGVCKMVKQIVEGIFEQQLKALKVGERRNVFACWTHIVCCVRRTVE